jgi:hypothetical protein
MRIRSAGNGEPGTNGGPAGDLYIEIRIKQHEIFERDGDDLHCDVPIRISQAALGDTVRVATLGGEAEIRIPAETQTGKLFRLRGKGVRSVRSRSEGDLGEIESTPTDRWIARTHVHALGYATLPTAPRGSFCPARRCCRPRGPAPSASAREPNGRLLRRSTPGFGLDAHCVSVLRAGRAPGQHVRGGGVGENPKDAAPAMRCFVACQMPRKWPLPLRHASRSMCLPHTALCMRCAGQWAQFLPV